MRGLSLLDMQFREILEDTPDLVAISLGGSQVVYMNKAGRRMLGIGESEDISGYDLHQAHPPDIAGNVIDREIETALKDGVWRGESVIRSRAGIDIPVSQIIIVHRDNEGRSEYISTIMRDMSDLKAAENALCKSENKYKKLIDQASDCIFLMDVRGNIILSNEKCCQMLGYSSDELRQINILDTYRPQDRDEGVNRLKQLLSGEKISFERFMVRKDGSVFIAEANAVLTDQDIIQSIVRDVSERRRIENEIKESEFKLRSVVLGSPIPQFVIDKEHKVLYWNKALEIMSGVRAEEVAGTSDHWKAFYAERRPCFADLIVDNALSDISVYYKNIYVRYLEAVNGYEAVGMLTMRNGKNVWVHFTGAAVLGAEGEIIGAIETLEDITQRKETENEAQKLTERLNNSNREWKKTFDAMTDGVMLLSPDWEILNVNDTFAELFGCQKENVIGKKCFEIVHGRNVPLEECPCYKTSDSVSKTEIELFLERKNAWFMVTVSPVLNEEGEVVSRVHVMRDITARKRMEEELRRERDFSRTLVQCSPAFFVAIAPDGKLLMMNDAMLKALGYSKEEVEGAVYVDKFIPEEDRAIVRSVFERIIKSKEYTINENRILARDGRNLLVEWRGVPVFNGDDMDYFIGVGIDITERRLSEEKILRLNSELECRVAERTAQLESSVKELDAFSYSVSHDLQAPLRAIDGFTKAILDDYASKIDEEGKRHFMRIRSNVRKMGMLIEDLLSLARYGKQQMQYEELDMTELARQAYGELHAYSSGKNIKIDIKTLSGAFGDKRLIKEVFVNLLSNAVKFTRKRDDPMIEVGSYSRDGETVYYVKDNGVGFDMAFADKLFKEFVRLHNETEFEGTGVGLNIVQRIVLRHKGNVWAEGSVGKGAVFYFSLPVNVFAFPD